MKKLFFPLLFLMAASSVSCDDATVMQSVEQLSSAPRATADDSGDEIFGDGMEGPRKYCCAKVGADCISWCQQK